MRYSLSEIINGARKIEGKNREEKETLQRVFLQKNYSTALIQLLRFGYDRSTVWLLPPGRPTYKVTTEQDRKGVLYSALRRLYLFVENPRAPMNMNPIKREVSFIEWIESLDPEDAEMILDIKDKIFDPFPLKFINSVFPELEADYYED